MKEFRFNYKEAPEAGNDYRKAYRDGIDKLIEEKYNIAEQNRFALTKKIAQNPDIYREQFKELLGWPLVGEADLSYEVKKEFVTEDNGVRIYRVQIITLGGLPFYGMLFISDESAGTPMIIANHGGLGAPELCGGLLEVGTINYNNMVERILKYKVNVFAPQYLNWNTERFKIAEENMERRADYSMRIARDLKLQQLGSSITAVEIFGVQRAIDWLIGSGTCRKDKIGMTGLSYGGFYTLFITAVDTRIKAAASFCFYSDTKVKTSFTDWVWKGAANSFFDSQVLALICPRKIDIYMGDKDE
ncbi:MAG: CocE/NonD family hydrolase, partial [Monoglobales bacterium]